MKTELIILGDQQGRHRIKSDIKTNLIVEAGAGSGKTTEMANRIVALLENGYRKIDEIAAITFTNKAANELKHRVYAKLESVYKDTRSDIILDSIENYHLCFIGTIHSFCSKLLRERPIEASVDPNFQEIEESEDLLIRNKIWQDYVTYADEEVKKLLDVLNVLNINVEALKNFLKIVCDNQDVVFNFNSQDQVDMVYIGDEINRIFNKLNHFINSIKDDLPEGINLDSDNLDGMQKSILTFLRKTKNRDNLSLEEKVALLNKFVSKSSSKVVQIRWSSETILKKRAKEIGLEMDELRECEIVSLFNSIKIYAYNKVFIPFVEKTKPYYTDYKKKTGKMNFQDLLIYTNNMLKDSVDVRMHFQNKYKTILVDEFQDTDPIQAQMLMYLTGKELTEKRWDYITPNEGSLFVVGDPKQSIYAFRRADIEIYEKFKELVVEKGGALVELTTNFRASQTLGSWYNKTFSQTFKQDYDEKMGITQAKFSELQAINSFLPNTIDGVCCKNIAASKKEEVEGLESEEIKKIIEHLVQNKEITTSTITTEDGKVKLEYNSRKIQYKDIMILTMKKSQLTRLSKDLSSFGLKVKAIGDDVVNHTPTFKILAQIVKMFARPEENAQLYRVMISKPFYFKDNELARFSQLGGRFNINIDIKKLIEENKENNDDISLLERIRECFDILKKFNRYSKELPSAAFIEKIAEELSLQESIISNSKPMIEMGSFSSLIEQIRLKPLQDLWGLDIFLSELLNLIKTGMDKEIDLEGGDYDAVRIMNVHKCKGLEAPIIILAGSYSGNFPNPSLCIERTINENEEVFFKGHISLDANPEKTFSRDRIISNEWNNVERKSVEKHNKEFDRLIYVAATRARNALIVMNSDNRTNPWNTLSIKINRTVEEVLELNEDMLQETLFTLVNNNLNDSGKDCEKISLREIDKNRNAFFNENEATYKSITPSNSDDIFMPPEDIGTDYFEHIDIGLSSNIAIHDEVEAMDFGKNIHKLFETMIKETLNIDEFISYIAKNYSNYNFMESIFKDAIEKFCATNLYSRIKNSDEVYCEVPFAYKMKSRDAGLDYYVNGIIDLVFKEDGMWRVVDYKTCDRNHDKQVLYNQYKGQLVWYKQAWEACTGFNNVTAEILFVEK